MEEKKRTTLEGTLAEPTHSTRVALSSKSNKNSENALIIIQTGKEFVRPEMVSLYHLGVSTIFKTTSKF